ncbi:MAG: hypothetical protein CLLPBCKN_005225 [Chroococcidiopsis cubana SAG 39.79]|jgi:hypothetical protein|uniref:Uncharacterized protein n=2 Tax=Chroococcidiopsis TaxID=54298 RepID=K9U5L6_CHRTP|nr:MULTISPECIES: hypothetical protein [Chroococcidiopsis]PSB43478.1 hypothetical protein C7B80_24050 [Cyanosarcina cf. burmensis CCALA 770]AFY89706.1 hypothetical protein Chro_4310 [Chroococcidiopsis thermalis PCC 7203]MDZ4875805.1 hypothetical protein [Chroococcidiopsis cubana SAG 39.79]PSB61393.1 hypothetical protein C7B79_22185 [Chroococcidiopsis cubana CCALA 043]RUT07496.1 hypothetical protein DSM107010_49680 [Chroococcidiopsis cubana SAG 39.79]
MSSFKDFMDNAIESSDQSLPASNISLASIQSSLAISMSAITSPFFKPNEEQKFSEQVSSLVQNDAFLSELSDQIGEPQVDESEDDFVKRSSNVLRKMLYKHFGIKE